MNKSTLYTRTGDNGTTQLASGNRVPKHSTRIEAYGTIDELNSCLGVLGAHNLPQPAAGHIPAIQNRLFDIGAYLATDVSALPAGIPAPALPVDDEAIADMEHAIDVLDSLLPPLRQFVLPGGCLSAAHAHVARTVCRRAERRVTALAETAPVHPLVIKYINRLSDYLFALARLCNISTQTPEIIWKKNCKL